MFWSILLIFGLLGFDVFLPLAINSQEEVYTDMAAIMVSIIFITIFVFICAVSMKIDEGVVDKQYASITQQIKVLKLLPKSYDLDSPYFIELQRLLDNVKEYNEGVKLLGENNPNAKNFFYIHLSADVDVSKYPLLDITSIQEELK